jgi:phosphoribosylformylglycinamidine synthase subunit PurQ / glutaminase
MKAFVLRGYGIECEQEMRRAALESQCFDEVQDLVLSRTQKWPFHAKDWVLLPGGFSYSDHFGSGRLLALQLKEMNFFETLIDRGAHALGVCNGFQVLAEANLFGEQTRLEQNEKAGFVNKWVGLRRGSEKLRLPVRHGEGRLRLGGHLPSGVEAFLHYDDEFFSNGSDQAIAGLRAHKKNSQIWGLMPHPEIALKRIHDPDVFATDFFEHHREKISQEEGAGLKLLKDIWRPE